MAVRGSGLRDESVRQTCRLSYGGREVELVARPCVVVGEVRVTRITYKEDYELWSRTKGRGDRACLDFLLTS